MKKARGFTLVELAVVIVIVALILGALLVPLATQIQSRNIRETRESLGEIKEALIGYAITQGRLPCPDTDRDGLENPCTGVGNIDDVVEGFLPWQDLAVPPTDAWDRIFRYAVTREFTETAQPGVPPAPNQLDLADVPNANIDVFTRGDNPASAPAVEAKFQNQLATNVPAVVLSVGNNGKGGSHLGAVDLAFSLDPDESTNVSAITSTWTCPPFCSPRVFIQRVHTPESSGCSDTVEGPPFCEYDDLVVWISAPVLLNRLVQSRWLP